MDRGGSAAVAASEWREEFRERWRRKYADEPDSDHLYFFASPSTIAHVTTSSAAARLYGPFEQLIREQRRKRLQLLRGRIPGSSSTLRDLQRAEHAQRLQQRQLQGAWPAHALVNHLDTFLDRVLRFERETMVLLRGLRRLRLDLPLNAPKGPPSKNAIWLAAAGVASFVKDRHRNRRGELDGDISWPDVADFLQFHGLDLSHIASDPAKALCQGVKRFLLNHPQSEYRALGRLLFKQRSRTGRASRRGEHISASRRTKRRPRK